MPVKCNVGGGVVGPVNASFYPVSDPDLEIGWGGGGGGTRSCGPQFGRGRPPPPPPPPRSRSFGPQFGRVRPLDPPLLSMRSIALLSFSFLFLT